MSTLYPSTYPKAPNREDPEFEVFEILKKLPDHYSVFYSKKFKGTKAWDEEREIDFIIFDGKNFLLCLEVKGGLIEYDGEQDQWYQNGKKMKRRPDRQSSTAMRSVLDFLGPDAKNLNLGWALGFPHCCLPDNFQAPPSLPNPIIIDQRRFNHIDAAVEAAGRYYVEQVGRNGITATTATSIVNRLTKGIGFVTKVGVRIERDFQQLLEVTEEQYQVLEDLEINEKMIIRGFAGTGKTVLATEFARRLEKDGKRVLFLFYNRLIAKKVARSFGRDSKINCTRFVQFAKRIIEKSDPDWWAANKNNDGFWDEDIPLKLMESPLDDTDRYDAIIIDEGQDFKPDWFEYLEGLLADPEEGRLVVFYDEHQDIFGRWSDLPWGTKGVAKKQLTENCRNTKSIIHYLNDKRSTGMTPFKRSPEGEKVIDRCVKSSEEAKERFLEDISMVLREDVRPGQIVVLLNEPKSESCLADVSKIGRASFESISRYYDERSRAIQFTTINMFKGLEADVVFLIADQDYEPEDLSEILYVQGSRARTLLYVYRLEG